jgi:hypothetical protein
MRAGGFDILAHWVALQTFRDFELIIVDGLYKWRDVEFASAQVRRIEPFGNPFPVNAFCRYANTGLAVARGKIAVFITDYTWLPVDCLERHAAFHLDHRHAGFMGPHKYKALPPLNSAFKPYTYEAENNDAEIDRYVDDINAGRLDSCLWSLFAFPFTEMRDVDPRALSDDPRWGIPQADPKNFLPPGPVVAANFHAKNESCPLKAVLDINGWDEDLDGSHGWQDSDLADRLAVKQGIEWTLDPTNVAYIVNPRPVFPHGKRLRPYQTNERIWQDKCAAGYPGRVNTWSVGR